jgi:hypothetical protein
MRFAVDNGAWGCHQRGEPFDAVRFRKLLESCGKRADFIVTPDIVCGGQASKDFSLEWLEEVRRYTATPLFAVQDGMTPGDIPQGCGVFVGGSTEWKLRSIPLFAHWAKQKNRWCHVGRVNTARRIRLCQISGTTSFDGTSVALFPKTITRLDAARRQLVLPEVTYGCDD